MVRNTEIPIDLLWTERTKRTVNLRDLRIMLNQSLKSPGYSLIIDTGMRCKNHGRRQHGHRLFHTWTAGPRLRGIDITGRSNSLHSGDPFIRRVYREKTHATADSGMSLGGNTRTDRENGSIDISSCQFLHTTNAIGNKDFVHVIHCHPPCCQARFHHFRQRLLSRKASSNSLAFKIFDALNLRVSSDYKTHLQRKQYRQCPDVFQRSSTAEHFCSFEAIRHRNAGRNGHIKRLPI